MTQDTNNQQQNPFDQMSQEDFENLMKQFMQQTKPPKPPVSKRRLRAILWLVAGAFLLLSPSLMFLGVMAIAYGSSCLADANMPKVGWLISFAIPMAPCFLTSSALMIVSYQSGQAAVMAAALLGLYAVLIGIVLAFSALVYADKATFVKEYLIVLALTVLTLICIGVGMAVAHTTPSALLDSLIAAMNAQMPEASLQESIQMTQMLEFYLPLGIFGTFGMLAVFAHTGARMASRTCQRTPKKLFKLETFDMPFAFVIPLIASLILIALSKTNIPEAQMIKMIGFNVLQIVRVIFVLQGFGVVSWVLSKHQFGCLLSTLAFVLALQLESMVYVVSIVGLVDVIANFRRLKRASQLRAGLAA